MVKFTWRIPAYSHKEFPIRKSQARSGLDKDWSSYRRCRNQVTTYIRAAKAAFNRNLIQDNQMDNQLIFGDLLG